MSQGDQHQLKVDYKHGMVYVSCSCGKWNATCRGVNTPLSEEFADAERQHAAHATKFNGG